MRIPWRAKSLSLVLTASIRFFIDDPRAFTDRVLERMRDTKVGALAEYIQYRRGDEGVSYSPVKQDFKHKNYSRLVELRGSQSYDELTRADRRLVARAIELDKLLESAVPEPKKVIAASEAPRVLFYLTNSLPHTKSGYTYRTQETLKALSDIGISVSAITRLGYPIVVGRVPEGEIETVDGIEYRRIIPAMFPRSIQERLKLSVDELVVAANRYGANILHTTTDYNNALVVAEAAQILGIPWIYEVRGELERTWLSKQEKWIRDYPEQSEYYQRARLQEEACMNAANLVVSLSEVSRQELIARGIDSNKIEIVRNGVDVGHVGRAFSRDSIRAELGLPEGIIVGSVTSVVDYEGLDVLIKSLTMGLEATVLIVGDGEQLPELKLLATELSVKSRVIFAGKQPNDTIWKWYAAMDAFVIPRKDTLVCRTVTPMKPVMAQAIGIPVVASDLPALREITSGAAMFVPAEDPITLAGALNETVRIPQTERLHASMAWAREHTWLANAHKLSKLYNKLLTSD